MSRPQKEKTTKVFKQKAGFKGRKHKVYGKNMTSIRTIFPDMDRHPKFANAPWAPKLR